MPQTRSLREVLDEGAECLAALPSPDVIPRREFSRRDLHTILIRAFPKWRDPKLKRTFQKFKSMSRQLEKLYKEKKLPLEIREKEDEGRGLLPWEAWKKLALPYLLKFVEIWWKRHGPFEISIETWTRLGKVLIQEVYCVPWETQVFGEPKECSICFNYLNASDRQTTPCNHTFHKSCLKLWKQQQPTCPLCRMYIGVPILTYDYWSDDGGPETPYYAERY